MNLAVFRFIVGFLGVEGRHLVRNTGWNISLSYVLACVLMEGPDPRMRGDPVGGSIRL